MARQSRVFRDEHVALNFQGELHVQSEEGLVL